MNIFITLLPFVIAINLLFSGVLYFHGRREKAVTLYSLIVFFVTLWSLSVLFVVAPYTSFGIFKVVTKLHFATGQTAYFAFFLFAIYYPTRKTQLLYTLAISFINMVILGMIFYPSLFIQSFQNTPILSERIVFHQIVFPIFIFWLYTLLVLGEIEIIRKLANMQGTQRKSLKYIAIGVFIAGIVGALFNAIFPFFGDFRFFALNPFIVTVTFTGAGIFTLMKYKLFNIKIITTELLTFSIWAFILMKLFLVEGIENILINSSLLAIVIVFGIILIRSVRLEVRQKEQLEKVSEDLRDLKDNLEVKIQEQTMEVKRAYDIEKKARIELVELDKAQDQFLLTTQHHLRTPLTILKGYLAILKEKFSLPEKALDIVSEMQKSSEVMSQSVNKLLQVTEFKVKNKTL